PDLMRAYQSGLMNLDQVHGIMELMISMCEGANSGDIPNPPNRMVVLDSPPDCPKPQQVVEWLDRFNRRSMFGALYYPWIKVANPRDRGNPISVPPCGHVMGVWGRTDETRGVYKAPANEVPRGVIGLDYDTNFREQELLNPKGINCIRRFPNRGIRIWGARTLVEPDKTEWRYISVRRLISYIEKSLELGTQWVVFEPNDEELWARVRRTVSNFLERIWREGALFGASPEQAFYVKCDEELNPPETMILGRLYIEVGICPVRPAEFVILRISQWNGIEDEE
ncbi:MAG: phage tail sheath family protein, partial [Nostoc sp.]